MAKTGHKGLKRLFKATQYSIQGLKAAWQHEEAFRIEVLLAIIFVPLAFYLGNTSVEVIVLLSSCFLIIMCELINSAIEAIVDWISDEHHELAGRAKDIGSAIVFIALLYHVVVWCIVLI